MKLRNLMKKSWERLFGQRPGDTEEKMGPRQKMADKARQRTKMITPTDAFSALGNWFACVCQVFTAKVIYLPIDPPKQITKKQVENGGVYRAAHRAGRERERRSVLNPLSLSLSLCKKSAAAKKFCWKSSFVCGNWKKTVRRRKRIED